MGPWEIIGWIILGIIFINMLPLLFGMAAIIAILGAVAALICYSPPLAVLAFIILCIYGHLQDCDECSSHIKSKKFYNCVKSFFTPSHHREAIE